MTLPIIKGETMTGSEILRYNRNRRFSYQMAFIGMIGIVACVLIALILPRADKIDGIEEIPQYDAVWRGHMNQHDWVSTDGQVIFKD